MVPPLPTAKTSRAEEPQTLERFAVTPLDCVRQEGAGAESAQAAASARGRSTRRSVAEGASMPGVYPAGAHLARAPAGAARSARLRRLRLARQQEEVHAAARPAALGHEQVERQR